MGDARTAARWWALAGDSPTQNLELSTDAFRLVTSLDSGLTMATPTTPETASASDRWHAVLAGYLGWTLDAFDFFVVIFLFDTLAQHFHVSKADIVLTVTAALAMRPVGALLFG